MVDHGNSDSQARRFLVVLEGHAASIDSLARELRRADIVHFAGHGYGNSGYGALLFAPNNPATADFQLLRAVEMRGMDWSRCRLAVLSACASAEGETHGAHNPDSLIRALTRAGARIAASLWNVDSAASAALMTQFYRSLRDGGNPAEALRMAQEAIRRGTADIYTTGFLAVVPRPHTVTHRRRAATVVVPKPAEILGIIRAVDPHYVVQLKTTPPLRFPTLAEVLILVYTYTDENQILLDGHYWQPCSTPPSISLHLIATSELPEGAQHMADTEDALGEVIRNYPGAMYKPCVAPPWMDSKRPNFGDTGGRTEGGGYILEPNGDFAFALAELENPAARAKRLERLGRLHRQRRRLDCLWRRPDPVCADSGACDSWAAYQ